MITYKKNINYEDIKDVHVLSIFKTQILQKNMDINVVVGYYRRTCRRHVLQTLEQSKIYLN